MSIEIIGDRIPILFNQESFLLRANSYLINQALPGLHTLVCPAVKNVLHKGRPKGGLFIAYPDNIKSQVTDVSPNFWRLQAATIKLQHSTLLVINSYFPTDSMQQDANVDELVETLQYITNILSNNDFSSGEC